MAILYGEELVTRTKFIPPAPKRGHLDRPRLHEALADSVRVPLTVVVGGTGYGKSTLVASHLQAAGVPALWYELAERDADPQLLALHLAHLCHRAHPGSADRALDLLALPGGAAKHGLVAIEAIADALLDRLEAETAIVLDDFHLLTGAPEAVALVNHLVQVLPPRLHVVLLSRHRPELPDLARWRLTDDVVWVDQEALAFREAEIIALFEGAYGLTLAPAALEALMRETEGWPIALQLAARRQRENPEATPAPAGGSLRDLFDYMAREVLEKLTATEREFLLATAPLTRLDPALCGTLSGVADAEGTLRTLNDRGLFLIPLGGGHYRHHHLFREFLQGRLAEAERLQEAHLAAARALLARGDVEEAIDHLLAAGDSEAAAEGMARVGPLLVDQGRYARLGAWLGKLPPALLDRAPALAICQGDACRLSSRFDEAIGWYDRALTGYAEAPEGRSRALASKALVYLDTVQPTQAERLLEEAIACTAEPRRRAELLVMRAENKLNQGDMKAAEALFGQARSELPEVAEHEARVCLRTGRLAESRAILEGLVAQAPASESGTRSHREPALVLSLLASLTGEAERARELALSGLERAKRQSATWTEAVALMRAGHAELLLGAHAEAEGYYRGAIALARAVGVPRLKAEPLMGLGLLAARQGDMAACEAAIKEGLEVTQEAGDTWLSAMLGLALGAAWAAQGDPKAERWLVQAQSAYERAGDTYGQAVVTLWSARLALALGEAKALLARVRLLSELVRRHDYGYLLTRGTLLGFAGREEAQAFASAAVRQGVPQALLAPWLAALGLAEVAQAPSDDALRVRTLGGFRVWRGPEELLDRAWGREKARQLFHLLVSERGRSLPKSQIIEALWPEIEPGSADGTFRVALNALNKALEPDRPSGQASRFVLRQGGAYGLATGPDLWIDVAEFERLLDAGAMLEAAGEDPRELYRQALALYEGDFLAEFTQYEAWCDRERERLARRFAESALRLSRLLARSGDDAGAALFAQRVIERDPCAEEAYRLLMIAQYRAGDRPMAIRTYDRCVVALSDELDVDPMPETQALYARIIALEPVDVAL